MVPGISVVIPAFGRAAQLERAIDSLLSQTSTEFRIVVVDDASAGGLVAAREKIESLGHIWIAREENSGPAAARNDGASATDLKWIAFLDSDDEWLPKKLEKQIGWHSMNPDCRISQVHEEWVRNGEVVKKPPHWEQREGDLFSDSVERCSIGPSCVMIRRDLWNESGGFDESFRVCEDYELWLRITRSERVGLVPGPALVRKRGGHPDQLSTTVPALDRFRIAALWKLLKSGSLSEGKQQVVEQGIWRKAGILASGAEKRGFHDRAAYYRKVERGDLTLLDGGPNPIDSAWRTE